MSISRLIIIWIMLLDSFHIVFMQEIEEKLFTNKSRLRRSLKEFMNVETMLVRPRQSTFGGFSFLAVSLLFQLPLMEIIFVMGLLILLLGILLHFVELKADFFRLRRRFFREQRLKLLRQREEEIANRTLPMQMINSRQNDPYYDNNYTDKLYGQYSDNSYPIYRIPPFPYRQQNSQFSRLSSLRPNSFRHSYMNYPNFHRFRFPQRYAFPIRNPNRRQGYQHYSQFRVK